MDVSKLSQGTLIGHNRIEDVIGRGGSGIVYLAVDLEHNREVALKFLNKEFARASYKTKLAEKKLSPESFEEEFSKHYESITSRFKEEYQKQLIGVHHPNIAQVYQFGFFEGHFYFTTEYIKGYDIFAFTRGMSCGSLTPLFIQMLEGIQFIHDNGLLHYDIKPENVLIKELDGRPVVKIIDFGIATAISSSKKEQFGTPMFIPPEVILGWEDRIGVSSDLFSAAALMYYCIVNTYPFLDRYGWGENTKKLAKIIENELQPKALRKLSTSIPEYLDTIVMRLLKNNPEERFYGSARAVINALKTRSPDDFKEIEEIKSSYLIPYKHIGMDSVLGEINDKITLLAKGEQSHSYVYCICGERGMGKSHFLQKLRETAETKSDAISLYNIRFPADREWITIWINYLSNELSENRHPLIILIDDLHLLNSGNNSADDHGTIHKMISSLIRSIAERVSHPDLYEMIKPVLLCYTTLPDDIPNEKEVLNVQRIVGLKSLSENGIADFLKSTVAFKNKDIKSDWVKDLLRYTDGIPGELQEHLIKRDSQGILFDLEGNVHLVESSAAKKQTIVPQTTENRLLGLYHGLSALEKKLIDFLSVWYFKWLSPDICLSDIQQLFPIVGLHQVLMNLRQKEILSHDGCIFRNPYFPDLIYRSIDENEKLKFHAMIAEYPGGESLSQEAALLHAGFGGDGIDAVSKLIRLSRNLIFIHGNVFLALELLNRALNLCRPENRTLKIMSLYTQTLMMHALGYAGKYKEAYDIYDRTLNLFKTANYSQIWKLRLIIAIMPSYLALQRYDEASEIIKEGLKIADLGQYPTYHILLLNWDGRINFNRRAKDEKYLLKAKEIYEKSSRLEKSLSRELLSRITNNELGQVLLALGKNKKAIKEMQKKLVRCEASGNSLHILLARLSLAETMRNLRKYSLAFEYCQRALETAKKIDFGPWPANIYFVMAASYLDWNKYDDSIEQSNKCLSACSLMENENERNELMGSAWVNIGNCYNEKKEWEKSQKYFEAALDCGAVLFMKVRAKLGLAEASLNTMNLEKSMAELDEVDEQLARLPEIKRGFKFVSKFLRYQVLMKMEKESDAKELLPELKALASDNPVFRKEYKRIL
ncbi:MAG: tetratricopeptide repeat protein [Pseudomonadota bacterium]